MSIKRVPFQEPAPEETTQIIKYGGKVDLITKKYKDSQHIKMYERFSKTEMINIITGEIVPINQKDNRAEKEVYKYMKGVNYTVEENLLGTYDRAMLIQLKLNQIMPSSKALLIWKSLWEKLKRRLPKGVKFIRVLIYHKEDTPEYDFWIISKEPITIDETTIKALWEDGTRTAEVTTPITKKVLEEKAQYYTTKKTNMKLYKPREQILGTSKGIKQARRQTTTHDQAKKYCKGCRRIFESCRQQVEIIDNIEQEVQFNTYETYEKNKRTIKLKVTKDKRYIKKKIAPKATEGTNNEVKTEPKKKAFKDIEHEVQKILAEIGQEVQEKIKGK